MKKDKGIKLHKEFGLNPTIRMCFYCHEDTGEIAMLGASYKGKAPMRMIMDIEPCEKCRERFKDCTVLVENTEPDGSRTGITGRWVCISKTALAEEHAKHQIMYASKDIIDALIKATDQSGKE